MRALGSVLKNPDVRNLAVALEGISNILECGEQHFKNAQGENEFAIVMEQEGCLDKLEELQTHPNYNIYNQALKIIETHFNEEEDNGLLQALNTAG